MSKIKIFTRTMPFIWARLIAMIVLTIGMLVYMFIAIGILSVLPDMGMFSVIIGVLLLGGGWTGYVFGKRYISYLIKAGHIAVIAEMVTNKEVPTEGIFNYGKSRVKERFVVTNVFFGLNMLVDRSVKQIQRVVGRLGELLSRLPGVKFIVVFINMLIGVVLGYVDEAILARIFIRKGESAWKGAADGVVLYFQNWKAILKNAVGIVVGLIVFYVVGIYLFYWIFNAAFSGFMPEGELFLSFAQIIALFLAIFIIAALKFAFVDSYITISVISKYFEVTTNQEPSFDLYEKAKGWSKSFTNLVGKAQADQTNYNPSTMPPQHPSGNNMPGQMPGDGGMSQQQAVQQPINQQVQSIPVEQPIQQPGMDQQMANPNPVQQPQPEQQHNNFNNNQPM